MSKKIVVVGGVAGGASAAARARRLDAQAEIVIFERGEHVSFSNCCLPYHLSGVIKNSESLVLMTPKEFKEKHDIDVFTGREVVAVNRAEKTICVRDGETGRIDTESYDNGTGIIPTYLCEPTVVTVDNYEEILIDSGYYTADQLK